MKKLIILLIMLMAVSAGAETSKYGSMWKQNDRTVSPADDVVYVDFTGYTTIGISDGGGGDFSNITTAIGITFGATENMDIDASTTNHSETDGVIDITLTPSVPSTRGTQVTIDANGQNDTMAHSVTYTANGMEAGDVGMAMEINVNPGTSTGGEVEGLRITRTGIGGVEVNAIHVGTRVAPFHQSSGAPESSDIAFLNNSGVFVNATTAFQNDSSTLNYTLVPNQNDYIYVGHTSLFSDIELLLDTTANTSIVPTFEYSLGSSSWQVFGPNDSTAGLMTDGIWSWETLSGWAIDTVNGVANKYWIRVKRTSAAVTTDAVERAVNIIIPIEYSWGSGGDITAYDMMLQGTYGAGSVIDAIGAGTRCFFYPRKAAFRCGSISGSAWDDGAIGGYSAATGYNTQASGLRATAEGYLTVASGADSHAEGSTTNATASQAHAEGQLTVASASFAHAEGRSTLASGAGAHVEGREGTASGAYSHAQNYRSDATGDYSHAQNQDTLASGINSHAAGKDTIAAAVQSHVSGTFLHISSSAANSVMFGNYSNATERDANKLITSNTAKLANMDLIVDGDLTVLGEATVKSHAGYLGYESVTGVFEDYSAADVFYKVQSFDNASSFGNVSSSLSDYSLNITIGGAGLYEISRDTGFHGEQTIGYSLAIFKNGTAINESHTSAGSGIEVTPFFANLSSFGNAAYDTNSSLSFLNHNDKDQIKIVESSTGNGADEWCFEYETHFMINHVPHLFKLGNTQYNGGSGHYADVLAFDNLSSEWDELRLATGDIVNAGAQADYKNENIAFEFPNDGTEIRYIDDGLVKTRIRHNDSTVCSSGHEIWIDKLSVSDKVGPRSDSSSMQIVLADGDKITLHEKPDAANKHYHRHKTQLNIKRIGD